MKRVRQYWFWALLALLVTWLSVIPLRIAIATNQAPIPQAMFILGGDPKREIAAAQIAAYYPDIKIWISSGELPTQTQAMFQTVGITADRLNLNYKASDTVTNFTTLVSDLKTEDVQHVYLITSDFHMPRAKMIGTIVFGSQGIVFTPIAISSNRSAEPTYKMVRDIFRSFLWLATGRTGTRLRPLEESLQLNS